MAGGGGGGGGGGGASFHRRQLMSLFLRASCIISFSWRHFAFPIRELRYL